MVPWSYKLKIDGQDADPSIMAAIQELEVEETVDLADMLRVHLLIDRRANAGTWSVLDDDAFTRLRKLEIQVTIGNLTEPLVEAYVIDSSIEIAPVPGTSTLSVVAMDPTVLMDLEEKQKAWPNASDSVVAQTIFGDYGFDLQVDDTQPSRQDVDYVTMQRGTDIQFLRQLAARNGFECFVEVDPRSKRKTGHFHAPRIGATPQPTLSIHFGTETNVATFKARFDMMKPTTAAVAGLDIESGDVQSGSSDSSALPSMGTTSTVATDQPRKVLLSNVGLSASGELGTLAQAVVDRSTWAIDAEGELEGDVYGAVLRAKQPVLVRGAGTQFSGTYYVQRVLHHFAAGRYTQRFSLRRTATGAPKGQNFENEKGLKE